MSNSRAVEILLVEDDPQDLELALRALRKANLTNHIDVARDGVEAIEMLLGNSVTEEERIARGPKVVLLDLKLPRLNGFEVIRRIRSDSRTRLIPIVVLTSSKEHNDIAESYALGVNSYIVKPVNFERFADGVKHLGMYWLLHNQPPVADK